MIFDLTAKISAAQRKQWLEGSDRPFVKDGHIGTHLDTYRHSPIPLEYFKSKGRLIDAAGFCEEREIGIQDLAGAKLEPGSFVLFRTGRIERYAYGSGEYFGDHPQLSQELIGWLLDQKIRFIGIDCSGIRRGEEHREADVRCEEKGCYVIENLCELDKLKTENFTVYTMWLDDPEMTGLKCRVIAED